jgi:hypothetical protein
MPPLDNNSGDSKAAPAHPIQDAGIAAAKSLEKLYLTDGPSAASHKLRSEYLDTVKKPIKDQSNATQLDYELNQLHIDASKSGDTTLLDCATEWGMQLLQNVGAIDQASLQQIAGTGEVQEDSAAPADPYAQAMATLLNDSWSQLQGFAHHDLDGMSSPKLTYGDLSASLDVDERIAQPAPPPPPPPSFWQKVEGMF